MFRETLIPLYTCPSDFEQILVNPQSGPAADVTTGGGGRGDTKAFGRGGSTAGRVDAIRAAQAKAHARRRESGGEVEEDPLPT